MAAPILPPPPGELVPAGWAAVTPPLFAGSPRAARRFWEFFTAGIPNPNTRRAYFAAIGRLDAWCAVRGVALGDLQPILIAAWVRDLETTHAPASVKQHLAAVRMLFDWLVVGQTLPVNPAASVRGPRHVVTKGLTPVLAAEEARALLDSIDTASPKGLRDRAVLSVMLYSFARIGAVLGLAAADYYPQGKRWWFRFREKGGRVHEVPAHHKAEAAVDAWLAAAPAPAPRVPLFRSFGRDGALTARPLGESDVLRLIQRQSRAAGLPAGICCHSFRATGITAYLGNGGTIEKAQAIAGHASPRTTKLYDRTADRLTLDEIERIGI